MTQILLIRHAATDAMAERLCGRTPGIPLSVMGKQQAEALAAGLSKRKLTAIYSSPIERALETARHVSERHGLEPSIDERFTELDFGEWTGKTFHELRSEPLWAEYNRARSSVTPPGGEAPTHVLDRSQSALHSLCHRHAGSAIAIVSHGDVIRSLLTSLLSMALDDLFRFEVAPASVSEVWCGGEYPVIQGVNARYAPEL